jgi:hypothetical protein
VVSRDVAVAVVVFHARWVVAKREPLLTTSDINVECGLPDDTRPSDHIPVIAELETK